MVERADNNPMPQFLIRFDDICPTMNWANWEKIEVLLLQNSVRPILAVVPDNHDPKLMVEPAVHDFWDRVRAWQSWGWSIALHGYQHIYVNKDRGLLGLTPQSEFAGVPRAIQKEKLQRGLDIFIREKIHPDCWIAPSHSFDSITVELLAILGIRTINDGLWQWPYTDRHGITWVPQQLWGGLRPRPPGIWTSCSHHNAWSRTDLDRFGNDIQQYSTSIVGLDEAVALGKGRSLTLSGHFWAWRDLLLNHRIKPSLSRLLRKNIRYDILSD
jgi:hypothetical protein